MVIQRLSYSDQMLRPHDAKTLRYKGKDPMKVFSPIRTMLIEILEIDSPKYYEDKLLWDANSGTFQGTWKAKKPWDKWSKMTLYVNIWGKVNFRDGTGDFTMKLKPVLETEVDYAHEIQRAMWWAYSYLFYNNQRRVYMKRGMYLFEMVENRIREMYGMIPEEEVKKSVEEEAPSVPEPPMGE